MGTEAARCLARTGVAVGPGLTDAEFARIERELGFEFADDHRGFLAAGLPLNTPAENEAGVVRSWSRPWPNWRAENPDSLRHRLDVPIEGVLFDVEHNDVWHQSWPPRPADLAEALALARVELARVPRLVPVYGHRFLPGGHGTFAHPVLSVWQTDIIGYGRDLIDYVYREFGGPDPRRDAVYPDSGMTIRFWSDFV